MRTPLRVKAKANPLGWLFYGKLSELVAPLDGAYFVLVSMK